MGLSATRPPERKTSANAGKSELVRSLLCRCAPVVPPHRGHHMIRQMLASVSALFVLAATPAVFAEPAASEPAPEPKPEPSKAGAVNGDTTNHFGEKGTIALDVTTGPM